MSAVHSIGVALALTALAAGASAQTPAAPAQPAKPVAPAAPAAPAPPAAPAFDVKVVDMPAVRAVVLPMKGSYMQHPDAFQRLGVFVSSRGLKADGPIFGRYFSDPSVGEANLVWEVGIPVSGEVKAETPFEVKEIPASLTAVHVYEGSMEEIGNAWGAFVQWVMTNGYTPAGPATQLFKGDMTAGEPQVEMRLPVRK
jgi:effector-binding domain-containing protein